MDVAWTATSRRALTRLPEKVAGAVVEFNYGPPAATPKRVGKPLRFDLEGLQSARRADFRLVYRVTDRVTIVATDRRADVYRHN